MLLKRKREAERSREETELEEALLQIPYSDSLMSPN
jgi:hypothetical protein